MPAGCWPILLLVLVEASRGSVPAECTVDADCRALDGSACVEGNCTCPETTPLRIDVPSRNASYCLTKFNETGGNCTFDQQCDYSHGKCSAEEGRCGCDPRYNEEQGECTPYAKSTLIPIAVGVAIGVSVLGTLSLYLWLSRRKEDGDGS